MKEKKSSLEIGQYLHEFRNVYEVMKIERQLQFSYFTSTNK